MLLFFRHSTDHLVSDQPEEYVEDAEVFVSPLKSPSQFHLPSMKIGGQNESKLVSSDVSFVSSAKDQNVISSIDQYDFSSPVKLSKTPTKTIHKSPAYAFSPPLTRSAARRYNDNLGFNLLIILKIFFLVGLRL